MSAFLGPIHHWLYHKIMLQDRLTNQYLTAAREANLSNIEEEVEAAYGVMPEGSLEDLIDESNIHGWLQSKIILVENRYAMTVAKLLKRNPEFINQLSEIAMNFGTAISPLTPESSATEAYKVINDSIIDGMPCDHVNLVVAQDENEVIWKRTQCVHEDYWTKNDGDVTVYYLLRNALIQGMLKPSGLTLEETTDGTYCIRK